MAAAGNWHSLSFIQVLLDPRYAFQLKNPADVGPALVGLAVWSLLVGTRADAPRRELFWSPLLARSRRHWTGGLGGMMSFRLHQAQYDHHSNRAYVELRRGDGDGGEQLVVAVFTFCTKERLSKQRIKEEVVRKARHVLKQAALA